MVDFEVERMGRTGGFGDAVLVDDDGTGLELEGGGGEMEGFQGREGFGFSRRRRGR